MYQKGARLAVAAAALVAVAASLAGRALYAQEMKCYFKQCIVFEDGSRLCEVKEIPCPEQET
jgi:hypothetical protein